MGWDVELAKELKKRNPKKLIGPQIGIVTNTNPLTISILGNRAIITKLYACSKLYPIEINDKVLCLPTDNGQKFFIIDKVVT